MELRDEILKRETTLLQQSGVKEKLFYSFFTGRYISEIQNTSDGDIDKVCFAAFAASQTDVSKEIQRNINAQPMKGMHFSTNIISLIAFAIKSTDAKKKFLSQFFSSASLMNQFIITQVFRELELPSSPKIQSNFDKLIDEIFLKKNFEEGEKTLFTCFESASDLNELSVVRSAYAELLRVHPNAQVENKFNQLSTEVKKLIRFTQIVINLCVNLLVIVIATALIVGIPYFIQQKWTAWNLEPYITGIQFSIGIFWFVILLLFNTHPNWFGIINRFKKWLLKITFSLKGISIEKVNSLLNSGTK